MYQIYNYFTNTVASEHHNLEDAAKQYQRDFIEFYKHNSKNTYFTYVIREVQDGETTTEFDIIDEFDRMRVFNKTQDCIEMDISK